jgi:hypothetical protein
MNNKKLRTELSSLEDNLQILNNLLINYNEQHTLKQYVNDSIKNINDIINDLDFENTVSRNINSTPPRETIFEPESVKIPISTRKKKKYLFRFFNDKIKNKNSKILN